EDLSSMEEFARYLGIAFQIKDDILDVTGNEETLGKKTGVDGLLEKSTFVSIYGMEQSENLLKDYTDKAIGVLSKYGDEAEFLIELSKFLLSREN
ncbi:MAG: polyprenyl synthetase family protein, partial [Clostridia bacterium]|nr:polyprenyl synthetase family protein [Clostridia bacterium]